MKPFGAGTAIVMGYAPDDAGGRRNPLRSGIPPRSKKYDREWRKFPGRRCIPI